jgi:hypothetical protein
MTTSLSTADLEQLYDRLAEAIDAAGAEKAPLMLVKLALLAAERIGDAALFAGLIEEGGRDL